MNTRAKQCFIYSLAFSLGYVTACGGGAGGGGNINSVLPPTVISSLRMLSSSIHRSAIFPTNTGTQPVLAAMFQAAPSNPSALAQSYESVCDAYGSSSAPGQSLHAGAGTTGFLSLNFLSGNICGPVVTSVGSDENGKPTGFPIILSGTINTLVAYGTFESGNTFRCLDQTHTASIADNTFVRAYYDLAHDAVVLGSGTNQLSLTCSISIPPGDDIKHLAVEWLKS